MSKDPSVLTKFTKYYPTSFELEPNKSIKMSLPSEFNDLFDSQIHLTTNEIKELAKKYNFTEQSIEYMIAKVNNCVHVVSLSGNSADSINTTNMWGIYANNGTGLAFEFNFIELEHRANQTPVKKLMRKFKYIEDENYQNSMLSPIEIECKKYQKKIEHFQTKEGCYQLSYLRAKFEATDEGKEHDTSFFDMKNNSEIKLTVEVVNNLLLETGTNNSWNNKFLQKVSYQSDLEFLKKSFEAHLFQDLLLQRQIAPSIVQLLNETTAIFSATKLNIWEHEQEYRLLTSGFSNRDWLSKSIKTDEQIGLLDDFIKKNTTERYYYKFSHAPVDSILDDIAGFGATEIINLPFPKRVYLGWDFDGSIKNDKGEIISSTDEAISKIKEFCTKYNVELYQLKKFVDYENGTFASEKLSHKIF